MIRIGKMTDYGVVLLSIFARGPKKSALTARLLSHTSQLPLPTVSKLLKALCKSGVLVSQRGVNGGYCLSRSPDKISFAEVIEILEGPIAITECSAPKVRHCGRDPNCPVRSNWNEVTRTIREALKKLTLADIAQSQVWPVDSKPEEGTLRDERQGSL